MGTAALRAEGEIAEIAEKAEIATVLIISIRYVLLSSLGVSWSLSLR